LKLAYKDLFEGVMANGLTYPTTVYMSQRTMDRANELAKGQDWTSKSPWKLSVDDTVPDGDVKVSFTFKWDRTND
jgi:hypothetical protein